MNVDAVEQWTADALPVAEHLSRAAAALALGISVVTAGAGITATVTRA